MIPNFKPTPNGHRLNQWIRTVSDNVTAHNKIGSINNNPQLNTPTGWADLNSNSIKRWTDYVGNYNASSSYVSGEIVTVTANATTTIATIPYYTYKGKWLCLKDIPPAADQSPSICYAPIYPESTYWTWLSAPPAEMHMCTSEGELTFYIFGIQKQP
jgi:hypothetical protein